jgi:hypothetical protein
MTASVSPAFALTSLDLTGNQQFAEFSSAVGSHRRAGVVLSVLYWRRTKSRFGIERSAVFQTASDSNLIKFLKVYYRIDLKHTSVSITFCVMKYK